MEKLKLDHGVLELEINENGVLRFNPSDPNVYRRFYGLMEELPGLQERYVAEAERQTAAGAEQTPALLKQMYEIDREIKDRLAECFGAENDFDRLLGGVSLMAFGSNGERVITNLLSALMPYIKAGVERHAGHAAEKAVAEAERNRAERQSL